MSPSKTFAAISIFSLVAMCAFAADTPTPESGNGVSSACKQDIQTLCPDVKPGEGRLKDCIRTHRDQVSGACKAAIKAGHQKSEQPPASPPPPQ